MTTNSIIYEKEFFYFDPELKERIINPRTEERNTINIELDKKGTNKHLLTSNYDLEVFPREDIAKVFCNIKTRMLWDFETVNRMELSYDAFAESLLFHLINQIHFAKSLIRQHFPLNFVTQIGIMSLPNPNQLYKELRSQFPNLPERHSEIPMPMPFIFPYWY